MSLEVTVCEDCPCRNVDREDGGSCNLGFEMDLFRTKDGILVYASTNCGLALIKYSDSRVFLKPRSITIP